jgi:Fe-S-cluster containining protein
MEKEIYDAHQDKIIRKPVDFYHTRGPHPVTSIIVDIVMPITEDGYCPFLNKDLTCNIYETRPLVCRKYGDETHPCLKCPMQDSEGKVRSRQQKRAIYRQAAKNSKKFFKNLENKGD